MNSQINRWQYHREKFDCLTQVQSQELLEFGKEFCQQYSQDSPESQLNSLSNKPCLTVIRLECIYVNGILKMPFYPTKEFVLIFFY